MKISSYHYNNSEIAGVKRRRLAVVIFAALALLVSSCGSSDGDPLFTPPSTKITQTAESAFTQMLLDEAIGYVPMLMQPGLQVSMGYWSGPGNHGSLVRLLDAINAQPDGAGQKAIWDEGVQSSLQYPLYVQMNHEHWYERASPVDGMVTIYGIQYVDPYPVSFDQADQIWGQYSQRYADLAAVFHAATGSPVKAWCYVQGAKANRIFYKFEYPELQALEANGDVQVFFAKNIDADWQNPNDWIEGTANNPPPAADISAEEVQASVSSDEPRGIPYDLF